DEAGRPQGIRGLQQRSGRVGAVRDEGGEDRRSGGGRVQDSREVQGLRARRRSLRRLQGTREHCIRRAGKEIGSGGSGQWVGDSRWQTAGSSLLLLQPTATCPEPPAT